MQQFPPLVVASSALLCAWLHLGDLKAFECHMLQLCALCGVSTVPALTAHRRAPPLNPLTTTAAPPASARPPSHPPISSYLLTVPSRSVHRAIF